jgi:hypothetical protein
MMATRENVLFIYPTKPEAPFRSLAALRLRDKQLYTKEKQTQKAMQDKMKFYYKKSLDKIRDQVLYPIHASTRFWNMEQLSGEFQQYV